MKLVRTEAIDQCLAAAASLSSDTATKNARTPSNGLQSCSEKWVDHKYLFQSAKLCGISFRNLMQGTGVYFEPKSVGPPKPAEYLAFMERLRLEQAEKEYQELLGPKEGGFTIKESLSASDFKETREELTTIFNILISVAAVTWAIWYWTSYWPTPSRTLACLFGAILILVAEVVVYTGYRRRVSEAREAELLKPEKKNVVKSIDCEKQDEAEPELIEENTMKTTHGASFSSGNNHKSQELRRRVP